MASEEQNNSWMYALFDRDKIAEKTEEWTKEAEKAGMTLTEYLESISQLNSCEKNDTDASTTQENLLQTLIKLEAENERLHDALDKIREEFQSKADNSYNWITYGLIWEEAIDIIDKYRKEQA